MNAGPGSEDCPVEGYRPYLQLMAQLQLNRRLQGKIDLSGVVQQTMLEAHQAWPPQGAATTEHLAAWLRRILANNLADAIRKVQTARRNVGRERSLEAAMEKSSNRLEKWLAAEQSSPSGPLLRQEQAVQLTTALGHLSNLQREALTMRYLQGRSLAQIAERLGRSPTAVAGLLKRGLQQLRSQFPEWK